MYLLGIDIGGTKTSVSLGRTNGGEEPIDILEREEFATICGPTWSETLERIEHLAVHLAQKYGVDIREVAAIGVSCGGPLDTREGLILSPPNLPGWDCVPIVSLLETAFDVPAAVENDANACALAEWTWGAGRGTKHMIFLTFGTGMGAGLILNGQLYTGASGMAGEAGHVRLEPYGPVGYGKRGSFEGFCSGGGIAQLAKSILLERQQRGEKIEWCKTRDQWEEMTAKTAADALRAGDPAAREIFEEVGRYLGRGLAMLIDILNPEAIVLGSIYVRLEDFLAPIVTRVVEAEALPRAREACRIVPAQLGERLGDYAALSVAYHRANRSREGSGRDL